MDPVVFEHYRGTTADGQPLVIRRATLADQQVIVTNINTVCAEKLYLQSDGFVSTPDWEAALHGSVTEARRLLAVAEIEGQVVGHGRIFPAGFGHKDQHVGDVGLVVLQPYRGIRIGTQMLEQMTKWAQTAGYEKLVTAVIDGNLRALNLFAHLKFEREGVRERQFKIQGRYVAEILLGKFLNDGKFSQ